MKDKIIAELRELVQAQRFELSGPPRQRLKFYSELLGDLDETRAEVEDLKQEKWAAQVPEGSLRAELVMANIAARQNGERVELLTIAVERALKTLPGAAYLRAALLEPGQEE